MPAQTRTYRLSPRDYRRFLLWDGATRWPDPAPVYPETDPVLSPPA